MSGSPDQDPFHSEPSTPHLEPSPEAEEFLSPQQNQFPGAFRQFPHPEDSIQNDSLLFQSWYQPAPTPPARIPHLGHLLLLAVFTFLGLVCSSLLTQVALHYHLYGISTAAKATNDIHYTLGSMVVLYLIPFAAGLVIFPLIWHKGFFAGLQWNAGTALHLRKRLFGAACACFVLALADGVLMPGPADAPIEKFFQTSTEAWLLFAFGVTFAPFFEEIFFRGFLLPSLCTAWDWSVEQIYHRPAPSLDAKGHPQWTMPAMVAGSILTSIPFAWMHAEQIANSIGPLILLYCVSLVLCWVRLTMRSLSASVMVHSCYNFLLFSLMLWGTSGFQHLDKK